MKNRCEWCHGEQPRTARFLVRDRENKRATSRFSCGNHLAMAVSTVSGGRPEMTCVFPLAKEK
jgi:hypothetical protein